MGKTSHPDWLVSLQSLLTTVVIAVFVITFIIQAFQIPSESMENTLLIGDYLLVDKLCYGGSRFLDRILPYRAVHRGDIVVFHYPVHPSEHFVKRVVGVPGLEGGWWLQMKKLVEDGELIIPEGHYFVLGDNRDESLDSRYWGFVPRENIIGRPLLIYWSVRSADDDMPVSSTPGDKLYHFAYAVSHLFQLTRWNRTFRVVN